MVAEKSSGFTYNRGSLGLWVFVVVCAYFGFALYMLVPSALFANELISHYALYQELIKVPWWLVLFYASELTGGVGGVLRLVAGFFALYSAILFWRKKENAIPLIRGKVSTALLFEGGYYLSLIPSVVLGFVFPLTGGGLWYFDTTPILVVLLVNGVACLMMVMVIPPLLLKLRSKITQGSSSQEIVKWSCLTSISYLFVVFWFNYSISWVATLIPWTIRAQLGMSVLLDPINFAGFLATVFGLFLIAIFGLMTTLPAIKKLPIELSLRRIGVTMIAFGGYFVLMILLYVLAGGYAAHPTTWYEIIVPHNPNLWCVTFLFLGLPLLANRKIRR
jgi:hypothetical protein